MATFDFAMRSQRLLKPLVTVAEGTATSAMLYEFQKAFSEFMAKPIYTVGNYYSLDYIVSTPPHCSDIWIATDIDGTAYHFWFQRKD